MNLIEANNLTKLYGQVRGINDITLTLPEGVYGLVGPNGSGKSTFLKLITGQIRATIGEIKVLDQHIWNNFPIFSKIGFCPEHDAYYDFMNAVDFVTLLTRLHGLGQQESHDRAVEALKKVGLSEAMHRPIKTYSKGMRQRTKLAQSIAHDPQFLILDEPLSGLDPIGKREMLDLLIELGTRGKSMIVSSHVLHEIEQMTRNFLLIYHGRIIASGDVHKIRGLMNEFPHRIRLRCDNPRLVSQKLIEHVTLSGIEIEKDTITILTQRPAEFYEKLPKLVIENNLKLLQISTQDDNLEAVFKYLVEAD